MQVYKKKQKQVHAGSSERSISRVVHAQATADGAGVKLFRALGHQELSDVDPFLLLDEFRSDNPNDYIGGFPDHPHRGFETVTYMIDGKMEHRDSVGNHGLLGPGSVQWMTAGRGIIHSEFPKQVSGRLWGFQLWVNLPSHLKMQPPRYQDIPADKIPSWQFPEGHIRVITGHCHGVEGPVQGIVTLPLYIDAWLKPGGSYSQEIITGQQGFVYVFGGKALFGKNKQPLGPGQLGVLGKEGTFINVSASQEGVRFLLITGMPINEPIARRGPFVMNTRDELHQAFMDYQNGRFVS